jgi:peptidoglycan/xylan/chitin deacetylase (PgdA/CDA1 family)
MTNAPRTAPLAPAVIHLDLDGARHIFQAHGWNYPDKADQLFETGLRGALEAFADAGIVATLFVIAEDARDPVKAAIIRDAAAAGHELASHSVTHGRLTRMGREAKRREIVDSRRMLADAFGVAIDGFRAPGFHRDAECLELIADAGYAYDSSELKDDSDRHPYRPVPDRPLWELPLPALPPFSWPFHPSYSLVAGQWYFRTGIADHCRRRAPLVLLFHLTDFAEPLARERARSWSQRLFTLSYRSAARKRAECRAMLEAVRRRFEMTTTTRMLEITADPANQGDL